VSSSREIFIETFVETFTDSVDENYFYDFLAPHVKIRQDDILSLYQKDDNGISKNSIFRGRYDIESIFCDTSKHHENYSLQLLQLGFAQGRLRCVLRCKQHDGSVLTVDTTVVHMRIAQRRVCCSDYTVGLCLALDMDRIQVTLVWHY